MSQLPLKIINASVIAPEGIIERGSILIKDGLIAAVSDNNDIDPDTTVVDAQGLFASPGFIDIHIHGGGGADFMDNTKEAFTTIAQTHARYGTTSMNPTTLSSGRDALHNTIRTYESMNGAAQKGAAFIGLHIEGPYFAMEQRGAQDPRYIRDPDPDEYEAIVNSTSTITRWSAAPEREGAMQLGRYLKSKHILPAIAHTEALYDDVVNAIENGYTHVTHLYSAMLGVTRRNAFRFAGVVEASFLLDDLTVEIIADGVHLPPPLLKLVYKIKGPDKIALITDAMRAAGQPPGDSILGPLDNGLKVIVEDGVAKLPDRSSFAGSVATADRLVRNMIQLAEVPLIDAIKMMSITPAKIMGVATRKGSIEVGKDGDIVLFDKHINVHQTIRGGEIIFDSSISNQHERNA